MFHLLANRHIMPNNAKILHLLIPPNPSSHSRGHWLCKCEKPDSGTNMVVVCFVCSSERSKHPYHNFDHPHITTVVTFVPRKQSKKPQFFLPKHRFCWKSLRYVSAVRFSLFSQKSRALLRKWLLLLYF